MANHATDHHKRHTCGGRILTSASGTADEHDYCDTCGAFAYHDGEHGVPPVPNGTDPVANRAAWDAGEPMSPRTAAGPAAQARDERAGRAHRRAGRRHEAIAVPAQAEAVAYGTRLLKVLAPQCEPLTSVNGLLTQLDNYIAGLRQRTHGPFATEG